LCDQLFDSILLTLPRQTTSATGKSPSASVLELSYGIQARVPNVYDIEMVQSLTLCIYVHILQRIADTFCCHLNQLFT